MTQLEKYSLHLPYGLQCSYILRGEVVRTGKVNISYNECETHPLRLSIEYGNFEHEWMFKPLLRNISDLTKPITQKDYNDGKPFVPIERFGREFYNSLKKELDITDGKLLIEFLPFGVIQKLLKWHFAIGFEQGEYIEVTNENNPY